MSKAQIAQFKLDKACDMLSLLNKLERLPQGGMLLTSQNRGELMNTCKRMNNVLKGVK